MFVFVFNHMNGAISAYNVSIIKLFVLGIMVESEVIDANMVSNAKQINSQPINISSQQQRKVSQIIYQYR